MEEYQKGVNALTDRQLAAAEASFQHSLQLDPQLVSALLGLAEVNMMKGNVAGAGQYLEKAASLAPKDANVLTTRGHYLFFRKSYPEAENAFKTAITLDPKLERPHYELGDLYLLGFHKPNGAIGAYHDALAINPNDSRVHYTLANALVEAGQLDEAQAQLEEASRLDPKDPALLQFLGDFCLRRGKLDQAQQAFAKALTIDPHFLPARMAQGDLFVARKNLDQALSKYQAVLQIAPKSTAALVKIAGVHEMKGHWNEAEQAYRQALDADPKLALAANNLAWLLNEREKKPAEALKWATKAVESAPKDYNCQDTFGWVLRANGNRSRALVALKQANALAPANPQILYHLGILYQEGKQSRAAVQSFSKALELSKSFEGARDAQSRLDALRAEPSSPPTH
jgi:tetratricopeptide (TPR) repeat protein